MMLIEHPPGEHLIRCHSGTYMGDQGRSRTLRAVVLTLSIRESTRGARRKLTKHVSKTL